MSPMQNPNAIGAVPQAQAQAQSGQTPNLPPEQINALRQDPEIQQAVQMVLGKKIDMSLIPDNIMINIAGMVHKLGVQGAVKEFTSKMDPQILQQLRSSV